MKLNRWKGDGEQRKEYFERTSVSSFRIVKKKKKRKICGPGYIQTAQRENTQSSLLKPQECSCGSVS